MAAKRDSTTGKWYIQYRYTDWQGNRKKSTKRGFNTKHEAEEWLRRFLLTQQADLTMPFEEFLNLYRDDAKNRIRESTMENKGHIIETKILPYFGKKKMNEITPADVRKWQNELISQGYKPTYLRSIHNQLSTIFNFAVNFYDLKSNPARKAGIIGKNYAEEMNFWTKDEFEKFSDALMDNQRAHTAFMVLFWTGMRIGELLALTPGDIDFENQTISITKSFHVIKGKEVITPPKTPKSNRVISAPDFLLADIKDHINGFLGMEKDDRLFFMSKNHLEREMAKGVKKAGIKKIRIHDLRHSHCALLMEMGVTPLEAAERLGHEKVETTLNIYAHLYPNKQKAISDKLEKVYKEDFEWQRKTEAEPEADV